MGIDTFANIIGSRFEARAHFRAVIFVSLRMAASAMAPWSPMLFSQRLQSMGEVRTVRKQ
jgi:hypothetical protein